MSRTPDREYVAPVARYRLWYVKRGRARFASHRDFQRSFERALRRSGVPMAYSAGFSPHPRISYANAAPTGAASEAEYVEIGTAAELDPVLLQERLNAALPGGFSVMEIVPVRSGDFAARLEASVWQVHLPGADPGEVSAAVDALLASDCVEVTRMMKKGPRTFDVRQALVQLQSAVDDRGCAIMTMVVRHAVPSVRPDDVLAGLRQVSNLATPSPPVVTRMAQGPLDETSHTVSDPLELDRNPIPTRGSETA